MRVQKGLSSGTILYFGPSIDKQEVSPMECANLLVLQAIYKEGKTFDLEKTGFFYNYMLKTYDIEEWGFF